MDTVTNEPKHETPIQFKATYASRIAIKRTNIVRDVSDLEHLGHVCNVCWMRLV